MSHLPTHLQTAPERQIVAVQQTRIEEWRRRMLYADQRAHDVTWMTAAERNELDKQQESWRLALAREHREQEIRLQRATYETVRSA